MKRTRRTLVVEAERVLLSNGIPAVVRRRDWQLLEEVARLAADDAPLGMALTDPSKYKALRQAVTRFHLAGWSAMTPERVRRVAVSYGPTPQACEALSDDTSVPVARAK